VADDGQTPFHNPFAALKHLRSDQPATTPAPEPERQPPAPKGGSQGRTIPRAVIRVERTGRGGKEVTVVDQLNLSAAERDPWLKALKSALGCGGSVEGETLVLQGDQRKRLPALLAARGVKKVVG
jgi:translation initiation factor 1